MHAASKVLWSFESALDKRLVDDHLGDEVRQFTFLSRFLEITFFYSPIYEIKGRWFRSTPEPTKSFGQGIQQIELLYQTFQNPPQHNPEPQLIETMPVARAMWARLKPVSWRLLNLGSQPHLPHHPKS